MARASPRASEANEFQGESGRTVPGTVPYSYETYPVAMSWRSVPFNGTWKTCAS